MMVLRFMIIPLYVFENLSLFKNSEKYGNTACYFQLNGYHIMYLF